MRRTLGASSYPEKQHTLGHLECPACEELRQMYFCRLSATLTFAEAAETYMRLRSVDATPGAVATARFIKQNTVRSYQQYIRSLNLFFGPMVLETIHLGHFRQYQMARLGGRAPFIRKHRPHEEAKVSPVKPPLVNKELCLLKMIMRRANAWTREFDEFFEPLQEDGCETQRALTPEEQQLWLDMSRTRERWSTVHWYSILAFDSTCSTNELRALRIGDVSLHHQTISIPAPGAKNKYRQRSVALVNASALWALERLLGRASDLGATDPLHFLFPGRDSRRNAFDPTFPMTVSGLKRPWQEVREATRLEWFRMYDTRHTGITRLAEQGVPLQVIMSRAGHISPRMSQHYTHISDSAQRRWLQRPLMPGPVAPRPLAPRPEMPVLPSPFVAPAGYKTIFIAGVPISIPA